MSSRDAAKRLISRLPDNWQFELQRLWCAREIARSRFLTGEPEGEILGDFVRPGDWVVDVGANVGQYTLQLSSLVGPGGRVFAVEPVPETFAVLASNARRFPHLNVTLLNLALSDGAGVAPMYIPRFETGLRNYYQASLATGAGAVPQASCHVVTMPFDQLAIAQRIALIKVDAEGHDERVLGGMAATIRRDHPVLIVENPTESTRGSLAAQGYAERRLPNSPNAVFVPSGTQGRRE
jgi:FkbM family methyltransferase